MAIQVHFLSRVFRLLIFCSGQCGYDLRPDHRGRATMVATTRRYRMEVGEHGIFSERELADHSSEALFPVLSLWSFGPSSLLPAPGRASSSGRWCREAWQVFSLPVSSRSESVPGHQTALPCQPFHDNSSWICSVSCGQALVTTPPGTTKGSFVGGQLQLTACGGLDSLALSPLHSTPSPVAHLFSSRQSGIPHR